MPHPPPPTERAQALLALALERLAPPTGMPPDLAEIAAWSDGQVLPPRAAEIEAFIARDSDSYRLWRDYLDAQALLAVESPLAQLRLAPPMTRRLATLWQRWRSLPGFAPRLAVGLAGLLLMLSLAPRLFEDPLSRALDQEYRHWTHSGGPSPPHWNWRLGLVSRGDAPAPDLRTDPERSAFLSGLARRVDDLGPWPMAARPALGELPAAPAGCPAPPADCPERQQTLRQLGEWTLLLTAACAARDGATDQAVPPDEFWARQAVLVQDFRTRFAALSCNSGYCQQVRTALTPAVGVDECERAEALMRLAFRTE